MLIFIFILCLLLYCYRVRRGYTTLLGEMYAYSIAAAHLNLPHFQVKVLVNYIRYNYDPSSPYVISLSLLSHLKTINRYPHHFLGQPPHGLPPGNPRR